VLPQAREACPHNLAPTTSSLMQLVLGDALAIALLENRGFTAIDFRTFHPGGRLGAQLKFVRDIMQTGDAVPLAPLGTRVADAIVEMSRKGGDYVAGCVGITDGAGHLVGIVTDGDLRRHIRRDLLDLPVDAIMSRDPKTVRPDQLVSEALELLNSSRVSVLLVVDAGKPVGIVHFHHLLRAGVA
jgi:arabinose-5-phosphate isomerase